MAKFDFHREYFRRRLTHDCHVLLAWIQGVVPWLQRFPSWLEVAVFMRSKDTSVTEQDELLRAVFQVWRTTGDPRFQMLLIGLFWHSLARFFAAKRHWERHDEDRLQDLLAAFVLAIHKLDLEKRPQLIARKIINDTLNGWFREYSKVWRKRKREAAAIPEEKLARSSDLFRIEWEDERAVLEESLHLLTEQGVLKNRVAELIIDTRLRGHSLKDAAHRQGIGYELARKRHQRAERLLPPWVREGILALVPPKSVAPATILLPAAEPVDLPCQPAA